MKRFLSRNALPLATLVLVSGAGLVHTGWPHGQESGQDEPLVKPRLNPMTAFKESEMERLTEELEGAWMMMTYRNADDFLAAENYRGFAMFQDGLVTILFYGRQEIIQLLTGIGTEYTLSSVVARYRVGPQLTLQLAGMLGFSNANEYSELRFDAASINSEFNVSIDDDILTLQHLDGRHFTFRKTQGGGFPKQAIRRIEGSRSLPFSDE